MRLVEILRGIELDERGAGSGEAMKRSATLSYFSHMLLMTIIKSSGDYCM